MTVLNKSGYEKVNPTTRPSLSMVQTTPIRTLEWWFYLQSVDYNLWEEVLYGPHIPTTIVGGRIIKKPPKEWNEKDKKKIYVGSKAMISLSFF